MKLCPARRRLFTFVELNQVPTFATKCSLVRNIDASAVSSIKENLDSITHIANSTGSLSYQYSYDAWGRLRNPSDQTAYEAGKEPDLFLGRGYTGHEHLPLSGLVNMNARLYDLATGRFLSPDPDIPASDFSQSFNRYSYALFAEIYRPDDEFPWLTIGIVAAFTYILNAYNNGDQTRDENGHQRRNYDLGVWAWNPADWFKKTSGNPDPGIVVTVEGSTDGSNFHGSIAAGNLNMPMPTVGYSSNQGWGFGYSHNGNSNLYYPSYTPEQAAAKAYENARQSVTPWSVGWEWVTGTGPRDRTFYGGDYFTELLRQHDHIGNTRNMLIDKFQNGDFENGWTRYDLSGIQGVGKYIKDYSTLATGGLTGNLAATYLGSYDVEYSVLSTNQNPTLVQFKITNASTMASGTRPPVIGYWPVWRDYIGPFINSQFSSGPMSKTTQTFIWNEYIYW